MAEIKKRLAELEKGEKALQKSAASAAASVGAETAEVTKERVGAETAEATKEPVDTETTEATAEKLQEVDTLTGDLAKIEAMFEKQLGGTTEGITELPAKTLEQIDAELTRLEGEVTKEEEKQAQTAFDQLKEKYPWITENRMEFMYAIPPNPKSKDFTSWQDDWSKVLSDYARLSVLHVLYISKLLAEKPFSEFRDRDQAIRLIGDYLVDKKLAKWTTKNREELRVLWKSKEELASDIEKWGTENAGTEPVIVQELKGADQVFSTIPEDEWEEIFKILKKRKKITVDKTDSGQIFIKFLI